MADQKIDIQQVDENLAGGDYEEPGKNKMNFNLGMLGLDSKREKSKSMRSKRRKSKRGEDSDNNHTGSSRRNKSDEGSSRVTAKNKQKQTTSNDDSSSSDSSNSSRQSRRSQSQQSGKAKKKGKEAPPQIVGLDLTLMKNPQMSKIVTETLVQNVTRAVNEVNFMGFENHVKTIILNLLEKPLHKMTMQEELLNKYGDTVRKNTRKVCEIEYIMQKYQRATMYGEELEKRINNMEATLKRHDEIYDFKLKELDTIVKIKVPEQLDEFKLEQESWKRYFIRNQRAFENLQNQQQNDRQHVLTQLRQAMQATHKNFDELHMNQVALDQDNATLKGKLEQIGEDFANIETKIVVHGKELERTQSDFTMKIGTLTSRIDKAEADRMQKYYRQVGDIQTWLNKNEATIAENTALTDAISNYFQNEHQVFVQNVVAESLSNCLAGRELNAMIDHIVQKQEFVGQKKLIQHDFGHKEKFDTTIRFLQKTQPWYQVPRKIPEKELPQKIEETMKQMTSQIESVIQAQMIDKKQRGRSSMDNSSDHSRRSKRKKHKSTTRIGKSKKSPGRVGGNLVIFESNPTKQSVNGQMTCEDDFTVGANSLPKQSKVTSFKKTRKSQLEHYDSTGNSERSPSGPDLDLKKIKSPPNIKIKKMRGSEIKTEIQMTENAYIDKSGDSNSLSSKTASISSASNKLGVQRKLSRTLKNNSSKHSEEEQKNKERRMTIVQNKDANPAFTATKNESINSSSNNTPKVPTSMQKVSSRRSVSVSISQADGKDKNTNDYKSKIEVRDLNLGKIKSSIQESKQPDKKPEINSIEEETFEINSDTRSINRQKLTIGNNENDTMRTRRDKADHLTSSEESKKSSREMSDSQSSSSSSVDSHRSKFKIPTPRGTLIVQMKRQKTTKDGKPKKKRKQSSSSTSNLSSSESFDSRDKFGKKHEDWARGIMEDLREEWRIEDGETYVKIGEREKLQTQITETDSKANTLLKLLNEHKKDVSDDQNINENQLKELFQKVADQLDQIKADENTVEGNKMKIENSLRQLEDNQNMKLQQQFSDFVLKIEGELTRRNRLRIETFSKFDKQDGLLQSMQSEIDRFDKSQKEILGTIRKIMYFSDIQSSLNIQDELDREWVSLFSGLNSQNGLRKVTPGQKIEEQSSITLHKDCMSCTGNMQTKMNLFKVACLHYESNPVAYQGRKLDRKELLSLQKVVADLAKQSMMSICQDENEASQVPSYQLPSRADEAVSPERTFASEQVSVQMIAEQNSSPQTRGGQSQIGQLTSIGLTKAQNILKELDFKDNDLSNFQHMANKQSQVFQKSFSKTKAQVTSQRQISGYKRKEKLHNRTQSQLSTFLNSSMQFADARQTDPNLSNTLLVNDDQIADHERNNSSRKELSLNNHATNNSTGVFSLKEALKGQEPKRQTLAASVIKVGSQSFMKQNYNSSSYKQVPGLHSIRIGAKSRMLQPLPNSQLGHRPNTLSGVDSIDQSKMQSRPQSSFNSHKNYRSSGGNSANRSVFDTKQQQTKRPLSRKISGMHQQNQNIDARNHTSTLQVFDHSQVTLISSQRANSVTEQGQITKKTKTNIIVPLKGKPKRQGSSLAIDTQESERHLDEIFHDDKKVATAAQENEDLHFDQNQALDYGNPNQ